MARTPDGFHRKPMFDWFHPVDVFRTAFESGLAHLVTGKVDARDILAALYPRPEIDLSGDDGEAWWFDYVADIGDGFDPTYTVAWMLAQPELPVHDEGKGTNLPRGRLLIIGGDLAYPDATMDNWKDRFIGPYTAAFPEGAGGDPGPALLAIPGNHDWYDSLRTFAAVLCAKDRLGGWRTPQTRSYFAARLPHRCWAWGLDLQFDGTMDAAQEAFFRQVAASPGFGDDRVILCVPTPSWVEVYGENDQARQTIEAFVRDVLGPSGATVIALITGDLHHYARYMPDDPSAPLLLTSGTGGAVLFGTHTLQHRVRFPSGAGDTHRLRGRFPRGGESKRNRLGVLALPFRSWKASLFMGAVYVFLIWDLEGVSRANDPVSLLENLSQTLPTDPVALPGVVWMFLGMLFHSPGLFLPWLAIAAGFISFAGARWWWAGLLHWAAQSLLFFTFNWLLAWLLLEPGFWSVAGAGRLAVFTAAELFGGGLAAMALVAVYLYVSHWVLGAHTTEVYASQGVVNYKGFLRMRLTEAGLTIFPVGVRNIVRKWSETGADTGSRLDPAEPLHARVIDGPMHYSFEAGTWTSDDDVI